MKIREGAEHLHDEIDLHRHRVMAPGFDDVQRVLFEVHGEERHAMLIETIVEHTDDVRMAERCHQAELVRQAEPPLVEAAALPVGYTSGRDAFKREDAPRAPPYPP